MEEWRLDTFDVMIPMLMSEKCRKAYTISSFEFEFESRRTDGRTDGRQRFYSCTRWIWMFLQASIIWIKLLVLLRLWILFTQIQSVRSMWQRWRRSNSAQSAAPFLPLWCAVFVATVRCNQKWQLKHRQQQ